VDLPVVVDTPPVVGGNSSKPIVIKGTCGNDVFRIEKAKKGVKVLLNGKSKGIFSANKQITLQGLAGDDILKASGVDANVVLYGGAGDDTLMGSNKTSRLYGGKGNDDLQGVRTKASVFDGGKGKNHISIHRRKVVE
jgi:Ca2+-binding RTX toxin-like protein